MITFPFTDVINAIRNAKKGVEVRENLAQMGEYCKKYTEEAGTRADAAKQAAQTAATNAKASEKKATDAVAGIEQTKTDAVQAVQNAQTTATDAVQQAQSTATTAVTTKQTEAVQAVGTAQTGAVKAVDDERDDALQQVANSTKAAKTAASNAAASEQAAQASKEAAATSAGAAESSATAASGSASAAATSESNAASSAQSAGTDADRAEAAAKLAGTRANTDKTLTTENAPADAKAVGDIILDRTKETTQPIFYSKAEVDKLLAKKLGLHDTADNGVVASGAEYVRFGDGTQICWSKSSQLISDGDFIFFSLPFVDRGWSISFCNTYTNDMPVLSYEDSYKDRVQVRTQGKSARLLYIAIGRWK